LENIESKIRLFADDCVIYRKILNTKGAEKLQTDLDRLGDWAKGDEMKLNPNKSKALSFTRARVKDPLNYSLGEQNIPEASVSGISGSSPDMDWRFRFET
jgi:hypothetical protein